MVRMYMLLVDPYVGWGVLYDHADETLLGFRVSLMVFDGVSGRSYAVNPFGVWFVTLIKPMVLLDLRCFATYVVLIEDLFVVAMMVVLYVDCMAACGGFCLWMLVASNGSLNLIVCCCLLAIAGWLRGSFIDCMAEFWHYELITGCLHVYRSYLLEDWIKFVYAGRESIGVKNNASYFHNIVKSKCARNRIEVVRDAANVVHEGNAVAGAFVSHYEQFLGIEGNCSPLEDHDLFSNVLNHDMAEVLYWMQVKPARVCLRIYGGFKVGDENLDFLGRSKAKNDLGFGFFGFWSIVSIPKRFFSGRSSVYEGELVVRVILPYGCVHMLLWFGGLVVILVHSLLAVRTGVGVVSMEKGFLSPRHGTNKAKLPKVDVAGLEARIKRMKHGEDGNAVVPQPQLGLGVVNETSKHNMLNVDKVVTSVDGANSVPCQEDTNVISKEQVTSVFLDGIDKGHVNVANNASIDSNSTTNDPIKPNGEQVVNDNVELSIDEVNRKFDEAMKNLDNKIANNASSSGATNLSGDGNLSPIRDMLTTRDIVRAGLSLKDSVFDLIENGNWRWPADWLPKYPTLFSLPVPNILDDTDDSLVWRDMDGTIILAAVAFYYTITFLGYYCQRASLCVIMGGCRGIGDLIIGLSSSISLRLVGRLVSSLLCWKSFRRY
ncbi:reverse transcriptase domain, Reverse transcriptase zinc-binding domain protein [Artemisia annua]|uniref:Reverse transcriptase domain, Reverse transcriptase zinc-binding domain protein n=1 Tax=Artemisia annua TaxID=35608 RepID=A0A2U1M056_ARTAN|nr:reverse transcriptase domain, Reverse transcriptase zinc-binding domain protein [Artemisia annua]